MLEVVQERSGREVRLAGKKHRGARHHVRRMFLQARQQSVERYFAAPRFLSENIGAPTPRQDEEHHRRAEQNRRPSAFGQFEQIGREEDDIHENERRND